MQRLQLFATGDSEKDPCRQNISRCNSNSAVLIGVSIMNPKWMEWAYQFWMNGAKKCISEESYLLPCPCPIEQKQPPLVWWLLLSGDSQAKPAPLRSSHCGKTNIRQRLSPEHSDPREIFFARLPIRLPIPKQVLCPPNRHPVLSLLQKKPLDSLLPLAGSSWVRILTEFIGLATKRLAQNEIENS
jgi:hypothetical protein